MNFEFATATRIIFGAGSVKQLGGIAAAHGKYALLVTNLPESRFTPIATNLIQQGLRVETFLVAGEPTINILTEGVEITRKQGCDLVIGLGGGSAIDTGKAIAALVTNRGDILNYLEVVGQGIPITKQPLPMLAIPTTAGTGSEVTRNAVIGVPEFQMKVSLRSPLMLPKTALVDPEMVYGLPHEITASTGLDALTQLLEPYVSLKANPLTDAICRDGLAYISRSLYRAWKYDDHTARAEMSLASLFGGLALANSGLGTVHGFASVLGGMYSIPHGVICARLLPYVMRVNMRALESRMPDSPALSRYTEIAQIITGIPDANAVDGLTWVQEMCKQLKVAPLSDYGFAATDFTAIAEKTTKASSTKANPIQLTDEELLSVLRDAI